MNKKLNLLAILPIYGTAIILIYLYIKCIKKQIDKKKFTTYFWACGIVGVLCIGGIFAILLIIHSVVNISTFIYGGGIFLPFIVGGYLMNVFTFVNLNKRWDELQINSQESNE